MKSLNDIKQDMSALYDQVLGGGMEVKMASELTNIAGKNLKAFQLDLAERIFAKDQGRRAGLILNEGSEDRPALSA